MTWSPFVESNLGYLEYELCGFLHLTPRELGKRREEDQSGVAFLEREMIHKWEKEAEARDKAKIKSKGRGKNVRRV